MTVTYTDYIDGDEEVLYNGTYSLATEIVSSDNSHISYFNFDLSENALIPNTTYNVITATWNYVDLDNTDTTHFLQETYVISSYSDTNYTNKLGSITFNGLYKNNNVDNGNTSETIEKYEVLGTNGIYKNVSSVIIDFTDPPTRTIYLLKKIKDTNNFLFNNVFRMINNVYKNN